MKKSDLIEPLERLGQFITEMHVLGEIQDKILGANLSKYSPVEDVLTVTVESINALSSTIRALSGEILQELKNKTE